MFGKAKQYRMDLHLGHEIQWQVKNEMATQSLVCASTSGEDKLLGNREGKVGKSCHTLRKFTQDLL